MTPQETIVGFYEDCLAKHGDNHRGVDWPTKESACIRYQAMLDVMKEGGTLLDFGCGCSAMYEYILEQAICVEYSGLDLSAKFVEVSKNKFPQNSYYVADILKEDIPEFDYIVANGVFTEKLEFSYDEMWEYFARMLPRIFKFARKGIAFNVMSHHVDWEKPCLFHVPFDAMAGFVKKNLSRHFAFRQDYALFDYTTYVYK
jgi:hypothetical protein